MRRCSSTVPAPVQTACPRGETEMSYSMTAKATAPPALRAAITLGLWLSVAQVQAYEWMTCNDGDDYILWEADEGAPCNGCVTMQISSASFSPGSDEQDAIIDAMASWTG